MALKCFKTKLTERDNCYEKTENISYLCASYWDSRSHGCLRIDSPKRNNERSNSDHENHNRKTGGPRDEDQHYNNRKSIKSNQLKVSCKLGTVDRVFCIMGWLLHPGHPLICSISQKCYIRRQRSVTLNDLNLTKKEKNHEKDDAVCIRNDHSEYAMRCICL